MNSTLWKLLRTAGAQQVRRRHQRASPPLHEARNPASPTLLRDFSTSSPNKAYNIVPGLKKMMKQFYLKCHPDVQRSLVAKKANLACLQSMNGFLDTIEATCTKGQVVEWPKTVGIEFLLTLEDNRLGRKKRKEGRATDSTTRRRVELIVPPKSLRDKILVEKGEPKKRAVRELEYQIQSQFKKVLKVAGLPTPSSIPSSMEEDNDEPFQGVKYNHNESGDQERVVLRDEVQDTFNKEVFGHRDGPPGARDWFDRRFGKKSEEPIKERRGPRMSEFQRSRERFVRSVDWTKQRKIYNELVKQMEYDIATQGLIGDSPERKQDFVGNIISRVRINKGADIDLADQWITMRRLSLIFTDNFDELYMEDFGRMWKELIIILKAPRDYGTSSSALNKRRRRGLDETGFQFTYDQFQRVTIHIPIDFRDDELMHQLQRNLWDFSELNEIDLGEFEMKWPDEYA